MKRTLLILFTLFLFNSVASAKQSASNLELVAVTKNVYAIVGPLGIRSKQNMGNNATFGVVVTNQGVVLIDSGATFEGAARIHKLIKGITKQPIKIVINTGGQDHRWLGNDYFKRLGARIIANQRAVTDQKLRQQDQFFILGNLLGNKGLKKTDPVFADQRFDKALDFSLGGTSFQLFHAGQAHTPGDSFIWLPKQKVVFAGDIIYVERMLSVFDFSNSKTWINAFDAIAALKPRFVIPGHGHPTSLAQAKKETYDYLVFLRKLLSEFIAVGGGIENVGKLDQSQFNYLKNFKILKGRNAQQIFQELEFE
ncbi:MBL fold metallo-hydrolase [Beggiatoa alba]|nr:MBL fold metallo-hydrolase [Beggiatoa alba]